MKHVITDVSTSPSLYNISEDNACDTNYFVVAQMDQNALRRHYAI